MKNLFIIFTLVVFTAPLYFNEVHENIGIIINISKLYAHPDFESDVVAEIDKGTIISIEGKSDESFDIEKSIYYERRYHFFKIQYPGYEGWVLGKDIVINIESTVFEKNRYQNLKRQLNIESNDNFGLAIGDFNFDVYRDVHLMYLKIINFILLQHSWNITLI